ncbi:hypothetical protein [Shinella oryzae]|uniref:hypothetical protein n=1 Tax=Shinella oryzae TaxID=2871820 RepID=UPI001FF63CED|nr:hypothetical protein [Shinella oryzae]UPA25361.1 hypothetical protein K6301_03925 [Shinella oryzae]
MFEDMSFTKVVSIVGFLIGCAFITYVVRTMGYFAVIAPEYLGFFIETDLIMGAIRAAPFVIGCATFVYLIFWFAAVLLAHEEKVDRVIMPIDAAVRRLPVWLRTLPLVIFFVALFASPFLFEGDFYVIRVAFLYVNLSLAVMWLVQKHAADRTVHPPAFATFLITLYPALYETGKYEAIQDLNHSEARYSITAGDRSYVNALLLKASSNGVLLKVGNEVILYDRSQIARIERATDRIEQK